ncbi:MAG: putative rane protein, partial [Pseudonocardiales bacterium]|nr:putative rane protein [Pseudonocardiales bacterium]
MTHHGPDGAVDTGLIGTELLVVALLAGAVAYVLAARRSSWAPGRVARWLAGTAVAVAGLVGLAVVDGHDPGIHVAGHLLVGMVAPLLLATAAPVTLALRTLPHGRARVLGRLLRSRPVAVVGHPAVAALLDTGGMWLYFRTDVLAAVPPTLVHIHMLLAGYLFAFSLVGTDPAPHRPGLGTRAAVLVVAVAAHDVLAKLVYAAPGDRAEAAGVLLYYGGAPVHVVLLVLLGREWAAGQRRTRHRDARRRQLTVTALRPAVEGAPGDL